MNKINSFSPAELKKEADLGGRYLSFEYVYSIIFVSYRRKSPVFLVRKGENIFFNSLKYNLITLLFGWWAIPFGPKYSVQSLNKNFRGGVDLTSEVVDTAAGFLLFEEAETSKSANQSKLSSLNTSSPLRKVSP